MPLFSAQFSPGARILHDEGRRADAFLSSNYDTPHGISESANENRESREVRNVLYGAVVASYGFHATLVADSDTTAYRKFGAKRFQMVANNLLFPGSPPTNEKQPNSTAGDPPVDDDSAGIDSEGASVSDNNNASIESGKSEPHRYKASLTILTKPEHKCNEGTTRYNEEQSPEHEHAYILGTVVSNLEETFTINPASSPLDNKLRLIRFGPAASTSQDAESTVGAKDEVTTGKQIMDIMMAAYDGGKHVSMPGVRYQEVDGFEVRFEERGDDGTWRRCCIDGSIVRVEEGGWMRVEKVVGSKEGVDIVVPASVVVDV